MEEKKFFSVMTFLFSIMVMIERRFSESGNRVTDDRVRLSEAWTE